MKVKVIVKGKELEVDADLLREQARAIERVKTYITVGDTLDEGPTIEEGDDELLEGLWEFCQSILDQAVKP